MPQMLIFSPKFRDRFSKNASSEGPFLLCNNKNKNGNKNKIRKPVQPKQCVRSSSVPRLDIVACHLRGGFKVAKHN